MATSYYLNQLKQIKPSEFPTQIKVKNEHGETKWMDINEQSRYDICAWLLEQKVKK